MTCLNGVASRIGAGYLTGIKKSKSWRLPTPLAAVLTALLIWPAATAQTLDPLTAAQESFEHPVKYAIYSAAWHLSSNAGLRIVAQNQSEAPITLQRVVFRDETGDDADTELHLDLQIPARGWAETNIPYQNILNGNDCVNRTMQDDWRLVEISNYTLNPSVRGLIIENTRSFRIYQCVRRVRTVWSDDQAGKETETSQWVMYHFERLPLD